jgi:hypothetical protein
VAVHLTRRPTVLSGDPHDQPSAPNYQGQMSLEPAAVRLRQNVDLFSRINVICPVQSALQKYFASLVGQIKTINCAVLSREEGRWPSSRTLGRDAVDAAASCVKIDCRAGFP